MRLFVVLGLLVVCLSFPSATSSSAAGQAASQAPSKGDTSQSSDIGKSGAEFMKVCSHAEDATCQGWVEGFVDGFTVHDELLGVPRADRLVCIPRNATNVQIIQAINKYISGNPDKAHRATRLVAAVALAQAFPCKKAK
jgi:hypothetical protein